MDDKVKQMVRAVKLNEKSSPFPSVLKFPWRDWPWRLTAPEMPTYDVTQSASHTPTIV